MPVTSTSYMGNNNIGQKINTQPTAQYKQYLTVWGDNLSNIAKRFLGDASRWIEIYQLNKDVISDPNNLQRGIELKIPLSKVEIEKASQAVLKDVYNQPVKIPFNVSPSVPLLNAESYTVQKGELLSGIAKKVYGDASKWFAIYQANIDKITDPDNPPTGLTLHLPTLGEIEELKKKEIHKTQPTQAELKLLARAIMAEARGESYETQVGVATAVVNYAVKNGVSLSKLIRSSYLSSNFDGNKKYYSLSISSMGKDLWMQTLKAATAAYNGEGYKLIGNRDHFYDNSIKMPSWGNASTKIKIGHMYFLNAK